jgi:hypothetical protein
MDARHRFILQRLKDGFNIARVTIIEQFMSQERVQSQLNDFFRAEGIPTLIFFFQPPRSTGEDEGVVTDAAPVLSLNVASKEKMTDKAIYFVRTNPKGVTQAIEQDVCYGEIPKDPLADFDFILGQVCAMNEINPVCIVTQRRKN